jgi:hypothetical protein
MDRLARNVEDLRRIVRELTARDVKIEFVKEGLTFTGEDSPMSALLLTMLGAVAEFERSMIRERQREGIAIAKAKGTVYRGREVCLTAEQADALRAALAAGVKPAVLARRYGISRASVYKLSEPGLAAAAHYRGRQAPPGGGTAGRGGVMALTEEQAAQMRADAENAWRVDQLPEDQQPPVDPATISMPNFATSKVVPVRVTDPVYKALEQLAAQTGVAVSDVIRSAVTRYLRDVEAAEQ